MSADASPKNLITVAGDGLKLPVASKYQVMTFSTQARAALPDTEGKWLEVANQAQLADMSAALRKLTPPEVVPVWKMHSSR